MALTDLIIRKRIYCKYNLSNDRIRIGDYVYNYNTNSVFEATELTAGLFKWRGERIEDFKKVISCKLWN